MAWVHRPDATSWDGVTGYWWDDANTDPAVVEAMLASVVRLYAAEPTVSASWQRLFRHFNQVHGKGDVGYQLGEKIAIKINLNNSWLGTVDNQIDASPQLVHSLLRQLVNDVGIAPADIAVYDTGRWMPDMIYDRCHAEFPAVQFVDGVGTNGRTLAQWGTAPVLYADPSIPWRGTQTLARCAVDADYLINMAILKAHGGPAVTLGGKNHFGSLSNGPSNLHDYIRSAERGMGTYDPIVDLMGHEDLGGKTLLYIVDGLYGAPGCCTGPSRWALEPFNDDWPSSLFVSQDGVAMDSVGADFLQAQGWMLDNGDNYLHEAALADSPPSMTFYDPEGDGTRLQSLGAHEHWNDPLAKQYSRNLGTGLGIELVTEATRLPRRIYPLQAVRQGTAIAFSWSQDVDAVSGYRVYGIADKREVMTADGSNPAAQLACETPSADLLSCAEPGVFPGTPGDFSLYQVVGCSGLIEGPH